MSSTPKAGPELPATLGGGGWLPRAATHAADIGPIWAPYGVRSCFSPLRAVLLAEPGEEMDYREDPNDWLMYERPDRARIHAQAYALAAAFEANGVRAHLMRPSRTPTPNHVFCCDLFFMTPEGAVLARMAAKQRAGEERGVAELLARVGVPILMTPRGGATFEGADATWLDAKTVLVGVGKRTNVEAVEQLRPLIEAMGARVVTAEIGGRVQHLLGVINPVDEGVCCVLTRHVTPSLREALKGWRLVEIESDEETEDRRGMNFVTLGPRKILMPAGCPRTRERYEREGITCVEVDVSEYVKAAGAIGCLTGVLSRA
ncbi:MAG: dimethylarginine dimethylaminohydrolase family protein [Myxococcota bacterium]